MCVAPWPQFEAELLVEDSTLLVVQVNGKLRGRIPLNRGADQEAALAAARADANVAAHLEGKTLRRVIHVPDKLLNLVVSG